MIDKRKAEDVAKLAATNLSAMIIDATPKINGYLNGTATGISPLGTAVVLTAIGARHCGLNEKRIVELLTKLDADGVFGEKREAPTTFAIVSGIMESRIRRGPWEEAVLNRGGELTMLLDLADVVVVIEADGATVLDVRTRNADAKIIAVLPMRYKGMVGDVRAAGADLVYLHSEDPGRTLRHALAR